MEVDGQIKEAIDSAIVAGALWRAARMDKANATAWMALAAEQSGDAAALLESYARGPAEHGNAPGAARL